MQYLDYEKLDVYRVAMCLVIAVEAFVAKMPPGRAYLSDQLRRSSTSVVLNIAEGAGEHSLVEKNRFYRMAKRSSIECASTVEICLHLQLINKEVHQQIREQVIRIAAMLSKMMQAKASVVPMPDSSVMPDSPIVPMLNSRPQEGK